MIKIMIDGATRNLVLGGNLASILACNRVEILKHALRYSNVSTTREKSARGQTCLISGIALCYTSVFGKA